MTRTYYRIQRSYQWEPPFGAKICSDISVSADIISSEKRTVFWERSSRKTVNFEEQIMSKDKYPIIFPRQMGTIVFIILQKIILNARSFENWGISLGYSPILAGG